MLSLGAAFALLLWLLQESLASPASFENMRAAVSHPLMKLLIIAMVWSYLHHLFAGLRHLAFDLHIGGELGVARATSAVVMAASLALTAVAAVAIW